MEKSKGVSARAAEGQYDVPRKRAVEPGPGMSACHSKSGRQTVPQSFTLSGRRPFKSGAAVLSQAPREMSHRARLEWLQKRRCVGLWAACDSCQKYRFLERVHEPLQLPDKWYCHMNPDKRYANCCVPEVGMTVAEEEDQVYGPYGAGSVVWALMPGFPRWPALVDDDPDTEQYYWLDGFSDIPTYYNVVFFDSADRPAERAWISPRFLQKYNATTTIPPQGKYYKRLLDAQKHANEALHLTVYDRLKKFSFLTRYKGPIICPKKFSKRELRSFGAFTDESSDDSDDSRQQQRRAARAPSHVSAASRAVSLTSEVGTGLQKSQGNEPISATTPDTCITADSPGGTHRTVEDTQTWLPSIVRVNSKERPDKPVLTKIEEERTPVASSSVYDLSSRAHKDSDSDDFDF